MKEINVGFDGTNQHIVELGDLQQKYDIETDQLHRETLRALCHYAAVAAGELTDTAIFFNPNVVKMKGEGYSQQKVITHEFIVEPRSPALEQKRTYTYEERPKDLNRHGGTPSTQSKKQHSVIPSHVTRLTSNRRSW